jgi:hypothetical protein
VNRFWQFLRLSAAERNVLLVAIPLVAVIRLSLFIVPFPLLYRTWTSSLPRLARTGSAENASPERIVRLVAAASRLVPGARCLTRAVAAQLLLARQGNLVELRIGVRKQGDRLEAHAWLENQGAPISESETKIGDYTPFPREISPNLDRLK